MNLIHTLFSLPSLCPFGSSAEPLKCYQCLKANSSMDCKVATCTRQDLLCFYYQVDVRVGTTDKTEITKNCVPTCDMGFLAALSSYPMDSIVSIKAECCTTSLCNKAALVSGRGLLLSLGLGLLQALH
uniref:UPAR/Ly6 domain-containing protein n=1 Tax=Loxodonta africana TaxID=9785 RepID=G3UDR6_LOXAF